MKTTLTQDTTVNAVALTVGMHVDGKLIDAWGLGGVELYIEIGEWAAIATKEELLLTDIIEEQNGIWPGVFQYDVTEDVGAEIKINILGDVGFTPEWVLGRVREHIAKFCGYIAERGDEIYASYLARSQTVEKLAADTAPKAAE